jgi:hypothetical protein
MAWIYRFPSLLVATSFLYAFAQTAYITGCWLRAGKLEPALMLPIVLLSRGAYASGMTVGGVRWLRRRGRVPSDDSPRPRWW